jgi:uncharacterized protein YndB with AHSA1/START domain
VRVRLPGRRGPLGSTCHRDAAYTANAAAARFQQLSQVRCSHGTTRSGNQVRLRTGDPESNKERPMTEHPYDIEITRVVDAPPERVYQAFTDPDQFARWYGPVGFPVHRDTVEVDARVGGRQRFEMVGEADPSMRTGFDGRFDEVVQNQLLSSRGAWEGIPGQAGAWPSNLRVEFHDDDGRTRLVVREGPHPPGTADLGRQAWEMMLPKLESVLSG